MTAKSENTSAFPTDWTTDNRSSGMSKRFYAACAAMQGLLSDGHSNKTKSIELIIQESYLCADELLRQEDSE